ncbi:trypsinogen-like protein 3 [Alosa sapidissima]|uniref:trypsinogen-like protein 3 n=1 Tax=Alosa sapidissima TaxID=34773 RepID=UPI001C08E7BA|nr:trypsinogen-like protein 3 [Alosa sapidissima]
MRLLLLLVSALGFVGVSLGGDCSPFARPWLVSFGHWQSGALLNEWWVLTTYSRSADSEKLVARLGVDDLNGQSDTEQRIPVAEWINHNPYSDFRRSRRSPVNDLALVRLAWPARFTPQVQPIALPTRCPQTGEQCVVSGWGSTAPFQCDTAGASSRKQQCLMQPVLSDVSCQQEHRLYSPIPHMFCAGYQHTTKGNCLRDEGSVLVCGGVLQGVNGWGMEGCSGRPETYSRVCHYRSWIDKVMSTYFTTTTTTMPGSPEPTGDPRPSTSTTRTTFWDPTGWGPTV